MKLPVIAGQSEVALAVDFNTQMSNAAAVISTGPVSGGIPLLIYASRGNSWTYNRGPLTPDDAGLLICDFTQIGKGIVEWLAKKPRQHKFFPVLSGKEVSEADLDRPLDRSAYRGGSDGPSTTYQVIGAFLDSGEPFRFESSSRGGVAAVEDLVRAARAASMAQGEIMHPVIELDSGFYDHPEYGRTFTPAFRVVGYVPKSVADSGNVGEQSIVTEPTPKPKAPEKPVGHNGKRRGSAASAI